jgi:hypothetical protein
MTKTRDTADIVTDAAATYLTQSSASSTYAEKDEVTTLAAPVTNRNLFYNGAMQVHQRGTSTTGITSSGYYTADRWNHSIVTMGTWTDTIENDAPTGSGFRKSWKTLCTTADAAPAAGDFILFEQRLEGQDLQRIRKGTSSAQPLTLSFWVKSNVTGTYVAYLRDQDNTRQVGAQYTISASGTWEKKTITYPADTTGAFDNDNAESLRVNFYLSAGSDRTSGTLRTAWTATVVADLAVGQTNLAAATDNYWQITGVQLEVGNTATDFEFKSFGQELRECQRYYYRITTGASNLTLGVGYAYSTTQTISVNDLPVTMRVRPTALEQTGTAVDYRVLTGGASPIACSAVPVFNSSNPNLAETVFTVSSGLTGGQGSVSRSETASAYLAWSAEL